MRGFTLIEILLVIGILIILLSLISPFVFDFYKNRQLDSCGQEIIQVLRRAQLKAMSVENDSSFGVFLGNNSYILFKGESFEKRDIQYDEIYELSKFIKISGIQEIVFSKNEGLPSITGTIVLAANGDKRTITINKIGRINLE